MYIGFAYFYQQVSDFKAAEENYKKALAMDPTNADAMNNYGAFLCNRGRFDEAEKAFLQAVSQPDYIKIADTYENAGALLDAKSQEMTRPTSTIVWPWV